MPNAKPDHSFVPNSRLLSSETHFRLIGIASLSRIAVHSSSAHVMAELAYAQATTRSSSSTARMAALGNDWCAGRGRLCAPQSLGLVSSRRPDCGDLLLCDLENSCPKLVGCDCHPQTLVIIQPSWAVFTYSCDRDLAISITREIVSADGMAQIGPALGAPIFDDSGSACWMP